jgi:hypothetical protein
MTEEGIFSSAAAASSSSDAAASRQGVSSSRATGVSLLLESSFPVPFELSSLRAKPAGEGGRSLFLHGSDSLPFISDDELRRRINAAGYEVAMLRRSANSSSVYVRFVHPEAARRLINYLFWFQDGLAHEGDGHHDDSGAEEPAPEPPDKPGAAKRRRTEGGEEEEEEEELEGQEERGPRGWRHILCYNFPPESPQQSLRRWLSGFGEVEEVVELAQETPVFRGAPPRRWVDDEGLEGKAYILFARKEGATECVAACGSDLDSKTEDGAICQYWRY